MVGMRNIWLKSVYVMSNVKDLPRKSADLQDEHDTLHVSIRCSYGSKAQLVS